MIIKKQLIKKFLSDEHYESYIKNYNKTMSISPNIIKNNFIKEENKINIHIKHLIEFGNDFSTYFKFHI